MINENLKELREKEPTLVPEKMAAEDFATVDDAVIKTSSTLPEENILQEATQTENDEVEEIEDNDKELIALSTKDVENSLEILRNLSLLVKKEVTKCKILLINLKLY